MHYPTSANGSIRAMPPLHVLPHGGATQPFNFSLAFAIAKALLGIALGMAALNNLPHLVQIGPTTFNAAIATAAVPASFATVLLFSRVPYAALTPLLFYFGFLAYACIYILLIPYKLQSFQNVTLYLAVGGLALVSFQCGGCRPGFSRFLANSIKASVWVASSFWIFFAVTGLSGVDGVFAPRAYALFAVAGCAIYVAEAKNRQPLALVKAFILFVLCLSTVSRAASAMACIVMAMLFLDAARPYFWFKALLSVAFAIAMFGAISFLVPSFHESSFSAGEALHIGELAINTKGRLFWWSIIWESFVLSPYFGQGPGSFADVFHLAVQPHNDHLRLLHDFGVVGYSLWWLAIGGALVIIAKGWRRALFASRPDLPILMGSFLYCGAFILTMITDNVLIYSPNAFPFAIMLGGALGISGRLIVSTGTGRSGQTVDASVGRTSRRPYSSGNPF